MFPVNRNINFQRGTPNQSRVFERFYAEELRRIGADVRRPGIRSRILAYTRALLRYAGLLW